MWLTLNLETSGGIVVEAVCYKPGGRGFEADEVTDIY
jgi:hypothetical protein